ncbi:MAG: hypothetical protein RLO18_25120 [Gimesia chilikensis]
MADGLLRVTTYSLRTYWRSVFVLIAVMLFPSLLVRFLFFLDRIMSDQHSVLYYRQFPFYTGFPVGVHFFSIYITGFAFLIFYLMVLEFNQKLMPRMPVSTAGFVSGLNVSLLMILCMVSMISNGAFRLFLFDADGFRKYWPVAGPMLFFMTSIVVVQWIYWDIQRVGFARLLFWISFVLGMCYWFRSRYYLDVHDIYSIAPWSKMTWPEFFTMLTVFVTAWFGAIRSCARVRSGAAVPSRMWERVWRAVGRLGHVSWGAGPAQSDSVASAFARLYWRDSCSAPVLLYVLFGTGVLTFSPLMDEKPSELGALAIVCLIYLIFCMSISHADAHNKRYLAAAPLSDRDMAAILVRAHMKQVVLFVSAVLLLGLAGSSLVSLVAKGAESTRVLWPWAILSASNISWYQAYAMLLLVAWIMMSNTISLLWSPNQKLKHFCFYVFLLFPILAYFIYEYFNWMPSRIWGDVIIILSSVLIWSITIIAYFRAFQIGLINIRAACLAAMFCLVATTLSWNFHETNGLSLRVLFSSLLILTVTPFATIPLSVSRSRHC